MREELSLSKAEIEERTGCPVHHFCYPRGKTNTEVKTTL
ncbi:MAG: hypothetical protein KAV83_02870 [Desulfobacterales bacterium]|nr:hypothetical protein [Desulfobacterales bacterium]